MQVETNEITHILLVEDSELDIELVQRELTKGLPNYTLHCVSTYRDYLQALEGNQPDLIISDYTMPTFDGLTVIQIAKQTYPTTSVIILTGSINEDTAVACMKAGADDYVLKENLQRLNPAIRHALAKNRLQQERYLTQEALNESQERLKMALAGAQMGVWEWDLQTDTIVWSPECYAILGRDKLAGSVAEFLAIIHPQDVDYVLARKQRAVDNGTTYEAEFRILTLTQEVRWVSNVGQIKYSTEEEPLRLISTIRDVTGRRQAAAEQEELQAQLRQAQKLESIGRLAGGIAHDFNNLLTVISGYTFIAQSRTPAEDPLQKTLARIEHATERAEQLTQQLLAFSRKQMLKPKIIDLNVLVRNLHHMLERLIGEDIYLSTDLEATTRTVTADASQIEQVIINLVLNARDAMLSGGRITVETSELDIDEAYLAKHPRLNMSVGPCLVLSVSDTGHGINEATLAHIFEPFFTTKEPGKGTGLGLATAYGIIKQSGADITVHSQVGVGTVFQIFFPANEESLVVEQSAEPAKDVVGGQETILLVEDETMVRQLALTVLTEKGYTVVEVDTMADVPSLLKKYQIDLLLTDVVMPEMSGPELATTVKEAQPQCKVLFISGYTDDTVVHHGIQTAQVDFLPKPFSPIELAEKVRAVLDK